ncbi:MAG TPA: hypothetical protein VK911_03185 [Vicinamibacterales bacterium]|nr:hypothetical protein [Vicinamibacterales bacterium]
MKPILSSFLDGLRRVARAPAILLGVLLLTLLVALPPAIVLRGVLAQSLGTSLAAETAASGVNQEWWEEFSAGATGLGATFTPRIIGFGGVLDNLSRMLDNVGYQAAVTVVAAGYLLGWTFLLGGILDRYARNRSIRGAGFFAASGVFFFRFVRLGVFAVLAYALLFGPVHAWLFDALFPWATRDWTVERNAFFLRVALYAVFGALLVAVNVLFDYAKIRAVVEDRRSAVGALMAAFRFVRRHPLPVFGLYALNGLLFLAVLAVYAVVAPGAGGGWLVWVGFLVTELYLLGRLAVKLTFYASETSLFQRLLAHNEYTAAPLPTWPESPAAEAIRPPDLEP